jgi:PAS domain S-box-containing protein
MRSEANEQAQGFEDLRRENAELRSELDRLRSRPPSFDLEHRAELKRVSIELEAAKGALEERESREDLILESATGFAILTTDPAGHVTAWNEGARRLFGWDEAEALGQDARMIFTPEDRAELAPEAEMQGALSQGQAEDERWHIRKDGSRFWASGLMMPLRGADGGTSGFLKIMRDRTKDVQADDARAALRAQADAFAARQTAILGQLAEGVIVTDAAGRITFVNKAAADIHGVERLDVEPEGYSDAYHLFMEERSPLPTSGSSAYSGGSARRDRVGGTLAHSPA